MVLAGRYRDQRQRRAFHKQNQATKVVTEFDTGEQYGFNASKSNQGVVNAVNEALAAAKKDGTYNTIYKKWFGTDAPTDVVSNATATVVGSDNPVLVDSTYLTVCTPLAYRPFQFLDTDNSTIIGLDVDLVDLAAKKLGVTQKIVDIEFGQITSGSVFAARR